MPEPATSAHRPASDPQRPHVAIHHNLTRPFQPYQDGDHLAVTINHMLNTPSGIDPYLVADWAYRTFNVDLDMLELERYATDGETTFLAACVYRLLGHRSLSVGDVVHLKIAGISSWLACDPYNWRRIEPPAHIVGEPFRAATVYAHLTGHTCTRMSTPTQRPYERLGPLARTASRTAVRAEAVAAAERYVRLLAAEAALAAGQALPGVARIVFRLGDDVHGPAATLVAAYDADARRLWHEDDGIMWPDESAVTDPLAATLEWPHGGSPFSHEPGGDSYELRIGRPQQ
ncbi:hypothetical protein [Phytohabitans houttuyneae]|uniref:Uncharacterized protein n=1 Tax=Phytohabitans houttuyneae TaxID=1076126 RepID=A0A6V8KI76_9ACTN|nr:hypothetical protein [Phytohabitans houttuyneae]GFJ82108.1 hypothetical protein Phou_062880 [Phytohabitans houttuyneae]